MDRFNLADRGISGLYGCLKSEARTEISVVTQHRIDQGSSHAETRFA
jgi:hypothetical protein